MYSIVVNTKLLAVVLWSRTITVTSVELKVSQTGFFKTWSGANWEASTCIFSSWVRAGQKLTYEPVLLVKAGTPASPLFYYHLQTNNIGASLHHNYLQTDNISASNYITTLCKQTNDTCVSAHSEESQLGTPLHLYLLALAEDYCTTTTKVMAKYIIQQHCQKGE